jgi:HK97 family phage major capsid protein
MNEREVVKILADVNYGLETFHKRFTSEMGEVRSDVEALSKCVAVSLSPGGGEPMNINRGVYASLGEQLKDVANASRPGGDTRAIDRLMKVQASSGANEAVPSDGGFLIQPSFSYELLKKSIQVSVLQPRCMQLAVSANSNSITLPMVDESSRANGSRWGGIQSYWVPEGERLTGTKPKIRTQTIELNKLTGLCYASDELLHDSTIAGQVISNGFASELAFKTDDAIINGNGAGMPMGILNSPALVVVPKQAGQTAKTILFENIVDMYSRLVASSDANACWLINKDVLPQLFTMVLAAGTGGVPVFMPAGGASGQPFMTLFGKQVIPIEQAHTLGTVGDIMLVNLNEYLWIDKGIQQASSIHVRFEYQESVFRFSKRCDGQPLWNLPLTPYKGANTLSPFVALATRA